VCCFLKVLGRSVPNCSKLDKSTVSNAQTSSKSQRYAVRELSNSITCLSKPHFLLALPPATEKKLSPYANSFVIGTAVRNTNVGGHWGGVSWARRRRASGSHYNFGGNSSRTIVRTFSSFVRTFSSLGFYLHYCTRCLIKFQHIWLFRRITEGMLLSLYLEYRHHHHLWAWTMGKHRGEICALEGGQNSGRDDDGFTSAFLRIKPAP
jgi:hypothetical protein